MNWESGMLYFSTEHLKDAYCLTEGDIDLRYDNDNVHHWFH